MGIERLTPREAVRQTVDDKLKRMKESVYNVLRRVGEECIKYARVHGGYIDQTGNLRSSIGYVIIDNGRVISASGFKKVKNGSEGAITGQQFIDELIKSYSSGICLIVVAGMNYAAYVETRGYDVITGSELLAEKLAPRILKQLGFNVKAA